MRKLYVILMVAALMALAGSVWGAASKNVYLKAGGYIEAESAWRKGDVVYVLVNRDTLVELRQSEVDLKKTFGPKKAVIRKKKTVAAKPAATAATEPATTPLAEPGAVTPTAKATPAPAPPEASKAAPETTTPPAAAPQPAPAPSMPTPPAEAEVPAAGVGMALAAMGMIPLIIAGLILLLFIATFWKIYEKAGEAGWKSLIPIYNVFVFLKIIGKPWWWFFLLMIPLVNIIFALLFSLALAQKFGKSQLFGVGLFFLGIIFYPILAFDSSTYQA